MRGIVAVRTARKLKFGTYAHIQWRYNIIKKLFLGTNCLVS